MPVSLGDVPLIGNPAWTGEGQLQPGRSAPVDQRSVLRGMPGAPAT
jgi:hypothetical protein